MKVLCFSVTPSPYQRDFLRLLASRDDCELEVRYFEGTPDDSPWDRPQMEGWESVLPGRVFGKGRVRCHWNRCLPELGEYDRVIMNAPLTGFTTQRLFRWLDKMGMPPWFFWGEQLLPRTGLRGVVQKQLSAGLRSCTGIVAIGKTAQADYERRFPGKRVHNIPYVCDLAGFEQSSRQRVACSTCRFLFAGQMIERKGVDILLKAFSKLVKEGFEIELHLAGREADLPGWLAAMDPISHKRVTYHGFIQPSGLPGLFALTDVLILPSRHDGWGVVVNQALGAGMPVITSTASGAGRDLVTDGVNGVHVPPGDVAALSAAMLRLAEDPILRNSMSAAACVKAQEIQPAAAAKRWMEVLQFASSSGH